MRRPCSATPVVYRVHRASKLTSDQSSGPVRVAADEGILPLGPRASSPSARGKLVGYDCESSFGLFAFDPQVRKDRCQKSLHLGLAADIEAQDVVRLLIESSVGFWTVDEPSVTSADLFNGVCVTSVLEDADVGVAITTGRADVDRAFAVNEASEPDVERIGHSVKYSTRDLWLPILGGGY